MIVALDDGHDSAVIEALAGSGCGEEGFVVGEVGRLGIIVAIRGEVGIDQVIGINDAASVADVIHVNL